MLFDHWNRVRGTRAVPLRSDIEPAAIRPVLRDTFLLAADFLGGIRFRLAGTRVCALFCREMKGESFDAQWSDTSRMQIADALLAVVNEGHGIAAGAIGRTECGAETELKLLLLPLRGDGGARIRALGSLAPPEPPFWLGGRPLVELELTTLRYIGGAQHSAGPRSSRSPASRRLRHGFMVYAGGREIGPGDEAY